MKSAVTKKSDFASKMELIIKPLHVTCPEGKVEDDTRAPLAAAQDEAQGQGTVKWRNFH